MVTERLLLLGNLAFMHQTDQNLHSTLALGGKETSWAALNFQEQSGSPFHSRGNGWHLLEPCETPMTFAPPQIGLFNSSYESNPSRRSKDAIQVTAPT
jgi:hypothetical protein